MNFINYQKCLDSLKTSQHRLLSGKEERIIGHIISLNVSFHFTASSSFLGYEDRMHFYEKPSLLSPADKSCHRTAITVTTLSSVSFIYQTLMLQTVMTPNLLHGPEQFQCVKSTWLVTQVA